MVWYSPYKTRMKRSKKITVLLSDAEEEWLAWMAEDAGLTVSQYLRATVAAEKDRHGLVLCRCGNSTHLLSDRCVNPSVVGYRE